MPRGENKKKLSNGANGSVMTYNGVKSSRSVQNMAERSYSVSEVNRGLMTGSGLARTPHRAAGYGGAGQPTRGPHRFGNPDMRASYSERLNSRQKTAAAPRPGPGESVYKSNSSLDLDHEVDILQESSVTAGPSRREYGSHGSLDMMGREALGAFPGEGPVAVSTLTRTGHYNPGLNRSEESNTGSVISNNTNDDLDSGAGSPKQKKKAMGFWGNKDKNARKSQKSLFKKRTKEGSENLVKGCSVDLSSCDNLDNKAEDKHRRRFFSHYDTASVCASLSITAQLRTLQRRNTTTGASAASAALRGGGDSLDSHIETDHGDGINNELVLR